MCGALPFLLFLFLSDRQVLIKLTSMKHPWVTAPAAISLVKLFIRTWWYVPHEQGNGMLIVIHDLALKHAVGMCGALHFCTAHQPVLIGYAMAIVVIKQIPNSSPSLL